MDSFSTAFLNSCFNLNLEDSKDMKYDDGATLFHDGFGLFFYFLNYVTIIII